MRGVGDELAQLRLAAGAALHAVFHRVDHRVQGPRDVRDFHGARGGLLADAGQLLGVVGQVAARNVGGRRAHDTEGTQFAAHPRASDEARRNSDDERQPHLDRDKHQDDVVDAIHLHAHENRLVIDNLGRRPERAQSLQPDGVRRAIRGHMRQDLQRMLIQVLHREVGDDRTGRLPVLVHVLKGALGNAGPTKSRPGGTTGNDRPAGTRHATTGLRGRRPLVRIHIGVQLSIGRVLHVQVFARALGEAVQL